jgi:hypothetical protein
MQVFTGEPITHCKYRRSLCLEIRANVASCVHIIRSAVSIPGWAGFRRAGTGTWGRANGGPGGPPFYLPSPAAISFPLCRPECVAAAFSPCCNTRDPSQTRPPRYVLVLRCRSQVGTGFTPASCRTGTAYSKKGARHGERPRHFYLLIGVNCSRRLTRSWRICSSCRWVS